MNKTLINIIKLVGMLLILSSATFTVVLFSILYFQDGFVERKFDKEVSKISNIRAQKFSVFEGRLFANIEIPGKGKVAVLYGLGGLEYIMEIGGISTNVICPENKTIGMSLNLGRHSNYKKWFSFEVNNLQDLVNHYDDIVGTLRTFPTKPDPHYTITMSSRGEKTECSVYLQY